MRKLRVVKDDPPSAIKRAIAIFGGDSGGQSGLARAIGGKIKQAHVWNWKKSGMVPAEYCAAIEIATDGVITRHDLRPDIFGDDTPPVTAPQSATA